MTLLISLALVSKLHPSIAPMEQLLEKPINWESELKALESSKDTGEIVPYKDGEFYSVGYGHYLTPEEKDMYEKMSTKERIAQNEKWFKEDIVKHTNRARKRIPDYDLLSNDLKKNLLFAEFRGSLGLSPKTIKLINSKNFKGASKAFLESKEYRDAKKKKSGIAKRMEAVATALAKEK